MDASFEARRRRIVRVTRDEDRRLRERGTRCHRTEAARSRHEAARPLRRGRAERVRRERGRGGAAAEGRDRRGRGRRRLDGPRARAQLAAQGARDGRRPRGPDRRRRRRGLRPRRHEPHACEGARAGAAGSRPLRPAVIRFGRRRPLGRRRRAVAPPRHLAGRGVEARRRLAHGQAADGVRLRRDPRAAAGGRRRLRRDQRAALPVAQGDHGREVEAAGDALARRPRCRRRPGRRARLAHRGARALRSPPRGDTRKIEDDGSGAEQIVEFLAEKRLI